MQRSPSPSTHALEITSSFDGAVLTVAHLDGDRRTTFTLGTDETCDAVVPDCTKHEVVRFDGLNGTVFAPPAARLFIEEGAQLRELDRAANLAVSIGPNQRVVVELGAQLFAFRIVERAVLCPSAPRLDWRAEAPVAITGVVALLLMVAAFAVPPEARSLALDPDTLRLRATFDSKPPVDEDKPVVNSGKPGGAERAAGKNGKAGAPTAKVKTWSPPPRRGLTTGEVKLMANEIAQNSGVLGQLKSLEGSSTGLVFARTSVFGDPASKVMDGLVASDAPTGFGPGGAGDDGDGPGGGGKSPTSIGLDRLPTGNKFGPGGPGGDGPGIKVKLRAHKTTDIPPPQIDGEVKGGLDKEIIRRVIRRHMNEVKFCYERELQSSSGLNGRLKVQFTINANGQVLGSITEV